VAKQALPGYLPYPVLINLRDRGDELATTGVSTGARTGRAHVCEVLWVPEKNDILAGIVREADL